MTVTKTLVALTIAAGFATASFAQGMTPTTPATPSVTAAKVTAPAPTATETKGEVQKIAEPAKMDAAKTETHKADAGKPAEKRAKDKGHEVKGEKHVANAETKAEMKSEGKPAAQAPATK